MRIVWFVCALCGLSLSLISPVVSVSLSGRSPAATASLPACQPAQYLNIRYVGAKKRLDGSTARWTGLSWPGSEPSSRGRLPDLVTFLASGHCQMTDWHGMAWLTGPYCVRAGRLRPREHLCCPPCLSSHCIRGRTAPAVCVLIGRSSLPSVNSNQVPGMPSPSIRRWHHPCPVNQAVAFTPTVIFSPEHLRTNWHVRCW